MSGPRVSSGVGSKQDYQTPDDLLKSVGQRFGEIVFDLAAHAVNHKHDRYFAPPVFTVPVDYSKATRTDIASIKDTLIAQGASEAEVRQIQYTETGKGVYEIKNTDRYAAAFDSLAQDWAKLTKILGGVLWLNCEFNDCTTWAAKCAAERVRGANITLLTPASVGANWVRDVVAPNADIYLLNGRPSFDGEHPFPKDCMLAHFYPGAGNFMGIWNWRDDTICHVYTRWIK